MERQVCTHQRSRLRKLRRAHIAYFLYERKDDSVKLRAQRAEIGATESHSQGGRPGLINEGATYAQLCFTISWLSELV